MPNNMIQAKNRHQTSLESRHIYARYTGRNLESHLYRWKGFLVIVARDSGNAAGTATLAFVTKSQTFWSGLLRNFYIGMLFGLGQVNGFGTGRRGRWKWSSHDLGMTWGCCSCSSHLWMVVLKGLISSRVCLSDGINFKKMVQIKITHTFQPFCVERFIRLLTDIIEIYVLSVRLRHWDMTPHGFLRRFKLISKKVVSKK